MASSQKGIELSTAQNINYDFHKCVICQRNTNVTVTSTENGRKKIIEAAKLRKDIVSQRLDLEAGNFCYHMTNDCYKQYTLKKTLDKLRKEEDEQTKRAEQLGEESCEPIRKKTRSSICPREEPSRTEHVHKQKCIICSKTQHGGNRDKFRISESHRAHRFLQATLHFLDDIYTRVADLEEDSSVFGADLFYHKLCLEGYLKRYERAVGHSAKVVRGSSKRNYFHEEVTSLKILLDRGSGISLSEIRDSINSRYGEGTITNKEVKLFLTEHFGNAIQFAASEQRNEPLMVFSSTLNIQDVLKKLRSLNIMKTAAQTLRQSLLEVDFCLNDRFCDAEDLKSSWEQTLMPENMVSFFSVLFNVKQTSLMSLYPTSHSEDANTDDEDNTTDIENETEQRSQHESRRTVKLKALFQMMCYTIHDGRKMTPLHLMTSHCIYDKCKSRELLTSLNRIGVCVSYNEIQRSRKLLAQYSFAQCERAGIPLPSHFSSGQFTLAAFDNFDHADRSSPSGMCSNHDTVMTLFQVKSNTPVCKPLKSSIDLSSSKLTTGSKLPSQELKFFPTSKKDLTLPPSLQVNNELLKMTEVLEEEARKEFILSCVKGGFLLSSNSDPLPTWAACRSLLSPKNYQIMQAGFLPYIPYPVTQHATVYTALHNFSMVLAQLHQKSLPVFCDEGVFRIVVDIVVHRPDEFKNLIPLMGGFHMAKAALRCVGKYMKGFGIEDAFIETETFGAKVIQTVLAGSHYVRSVRGMLLISEAIQQMKWDAFWKERNKEPYEEALEHLRQLTDSLKEKNADISLSNLEKTSNVVAGLQRDFESFSKNCREMSEMCQYWEGLLTCIDIVKRLISADRRGDWNGHLQAVQDLLPIFRQCDSINYLRYASWYLEKMRLLPLEHPEVYEKFQEGLFVVRQKEGSFNAVSPDMKLEQTIQRSQKSASGIIGQTRQSAYVSEWEVVYHEVLAISNAFRDITMSNLGLGSRDSDLHHELSGNVSKNFQLQLTTLLEFIRARGNPYVASGNLKLHNFVTGVIPPDQVRKRFLCFHPDSQKNYEQFREERFVTKAKKLSDTIKKINLPEFSASTPVAKAARDSSKRALKNVSEAQRLIDIARQRGITIAHILEHDILEESVLFDGEFTTKPVKHQLVTELEKYSHGHITNLVEPAECPTALIVDFMSLIRRFPFQQHLCFKDLLEKAWSTIKAVVDSEQIDIVFDSYVDNSIKEGERQRRSRCDPLHLLSLNEATKLPAQADRFWSSAKNKTILQDFARQFFTDVALRENVNLVLSGQVTQESNEMVNCVEVSNGATVSREELNSRVEEADARLIPHIHQAVLHGLKRIVVFSNDTDVLTLCLHFMPNFLEAGLSQLWLKFGTGIHSRFIPLHLLYEKMDASLSSVLLKAHILTGCDVTSKVGTKAAALKAKPEMFLKLFGEEDQLSSMSSELAESFLTRVLQPNTKCMTMDQLRFELYLKKKTLVDLPPTSHSLQGHIQRCHFVVRQIVNLLQPADPQDPCENGWFEDNNVLLPSKQLLPLPDHYVVYCGCKKRCMGNCRCLRNESCCTEFCMCKGSCSN